MERAPWRRNIILTAGYIFWEVFCHELLQDTKVEDQNSVYLMKGNPQKESKNRQRSYTGDQSKQ